MKKNKTVNILFLGGAKRVSLGERFNKSAKTIGISLNIFSYELDKYVPISSIAEVIIGLKWNDRKIIKNLLNVISELNINIVLPFVDPAIIIAARLKKENKNVFVPVSNESICKVFFDKKKAKDWFVKNGFPVPENMKKLPLIAKPCKGSASKGVVIIRNDRELEYFINNFNQEDYLIQRFLEGEEYSVDCYVSSEREILSVVPRKRVEVTAGEVTKSVTVKDYKIIEMTKKILSRDKFIGPVNIQFIKENKTGRLFVIEVNPRFGGGVIVSIEAGADIPSMILRDFLGISNRPTYNWKENLLMIRTHREFFQDADNY